MVSGGVEGVRGVLGRCWACQKMLGGVGRVFDVWGC